MELVEKVIVTYLCGGGSDHYHQGWPGHLLTIGVGKQGLMPSQGVPRLNCVPAFHGLELGVGHIS